MYILSYSSNFLNISCSIFYLGTRALIKGTALIKLFWIWGHLFEARRLLQEIWYLIYHSVSLRLEEKGATNTTYIII